jgi:hypothetical protein
MGLISVILDGAYLRKKRWDFKNGAYYPDQQNESGGEGGSGSDLGSTNLEQYGRRDQINRVSQGNGGWCGGW